jgi:hypothetical protein
MSYQYKTLTEISQAAQLLRLNTSVRPRAQRIARTSFIIKAWRFSSFSREQVEFVVNMAWRS